MNLPEKGQELSLNEVKELCLYFELYELWDKITNDPPPKPFNSDGCSCWPDRWKDKDGKKVDLYEACLKHDLKYYAGKKGDDLGRFFADVDLMVDVVRKTKRIQLGILMWRGVRFGGGSWTNLPFRWGFGYK